jgi:hypothetical protein
MYNAQHTCRAIQERLQQSEMKEKQMTGDDYR